MSLIPGWCIYQVVYSPGVYPVVYSPGVYLRVWLYPGYASSPLLTVCAPFVLPFCPF